jgi:hypothetical protein
MVAGVDEAYIRLYLKFESGFQNLRSDGEGMHLIGICGNRTDDQWSCFGQSGIPPNGTDNFRTTIDPEQTFGDGALEPLEFYTYWPDMSGSWGNEITQDGPNGIPPPMPLSDNTWYSIQMRVKLNTPGQSDGLQELWINGEKKISQTGMRWRDSTILKINMLRGLFYMPNTSLPAKRVWVDNLVVSRSWIQP